MGEWTHVVLPYPGGAQSEIQPSSVELSLDHETLTDPELVNELFGLIVREHNAAVARALRERDEEWRRAVAQANDCGGLELVADGVSKQDGGCPDCDPLHAFMANEVDRG